MKQSKIEKLKLFIRKIISRIFNHQYGCCDNICKNCNKCRLNKWR